MHVIKPRSKNVVRLVAEFAQKCKVSCRQSHKPLQLWLQNHNNKICKVYKNIKQLMTQVKYFPVVFLCFITGHSLKLIKKAVNRKQQVTQMTITVIKQPVDP